MRTVKQNSQLTDYPRELRNVKTLKKIVKITKHIFWEDSRNYIKYNEQPCIEIEDF